MAYEAIILNMNEAAVRKMKAEIAAADTIPARYVRKQAVWESGEFDKAVRAMGERVPVELHVGDAIIYTHNDNFGTKKWTEFHEITSLGHITKVSEKQVCTEYGERLDAKRVIAVLRGE